MNENLNWKLISRDNYKVNRVSTGPVIIKSIKCFLKLSKLYYSYPEESLKFPVRNLTRLSSWKVFDKRGKELIVRKVGNFSSILFDKNSFCSLKQGRRGPTNIILMSFETMRCRGIVILKYMTLLPKLWQFAPKKRINLEM